MKVCFFICVCFGIPLHKLVSSSPCASMKSLSVTEGAAVVLDLDLNKVPLTSVTWDYEQYFIATTKPGQPVEIGAHGSDYAGRLSSNYKDGSLVIRNFSPKDARTYRAELYNGYSNFICAQLYDLKISGTEGESPSIAGKEERCDTTKQLVHHLGDNVTFQLPNRTGVSYILWDINNTDHVAITRPGQLERPNAKYCGRLAALGDGSLQLLGITTNDQRIFRAEVFVNNWNHYCTQTFEVKIKREIQMSVIIHLALSGGVLLIAILILLHHIRTECMAK